MDNFYLSALIEEIGPKVLGRTVARISLEGTTLKLDFRLVSGHQFVVSVDRTTPAIYLSDNTQTSPAQKSRSGFFVSLLRKHLIDARLARLSKEAGDRIVQLDFVGLDAGDNEFEIILRLALTGRSSNAALIDAQGNVIGTLFERDTALWPNSSSLSSKKIDLTVSTEKLSSDVTEQEVLDRFFGPESIFGPQLQNEFRVRCKSSSAATAFKSLVDDLLNLKPIPLIYSRLPLEKIDHIVVDPKRDLILSHIELAQAAGMIRNQFSSLSEAADQYYLARGSALTLRTEYRSLKQSLSREVNKRIAAINAMESDRLRFESPERLKRYGDLLLANLANARVAGTSATVLDYYDPEQSEIDIEVPEGATLQEAASDYFARYQKARRALSAIASRESEVSRKLEGLTDLLSKLDDAPTSSNIEAVTKSLQQLLGTGKGRASGRGPRPKRKPEIVGRRFRSTDGYEIVVGRNDRDNDRITFRIAKPHDIWLHAADYPGSHTIVLNPNREALPHRTITEAAELAAFYSQAKREGKAAVHYAQKKFVSKPPRAKPGLVRLSSFKTIMVEPRCDLERIE
ncbi:MAG TPA: NFACT family protein [Blastocatellia bacterium]|nr:NFACT family protein [Blastocatellia bacterium]